jgi:hypothetical protein
MTERVTPKRRLMASCDGARTANGSKLDIAKRALLPPGHRARRLMTPKPLLCVLLLATAGTFAADWKSAGEADRQEVSTDLYYLRGIAARPSDGREVTAHLTFFTSRAFRLAVVDLGDGSTPSRQTLADAFRAKGSVAGVNGGFFHPDRRPSGLVISEGRRINRFESAKLLSGVIYSDDRGIHLVRRARFTDHPGITALLQSGPYLVEGQEAVRGLSASASDRRTFVATDRRGHWVLGATLGPITLAELAECLASPGALTPWRIDRALNLDGGSSTGFYFDGGKGAAPVVLEPWKDVRTLLGITPRSIRPDTG